MALSEEARKKYIVRLLLSRMRILQTHGFYGLLLMHMGYAVSEEIATACTDGERIIFGADFLESLSDAELDFVMMHEILHVVLEHCARGEELEGERFNIACDIVVNSNILLENGLNLASITLKDYGESMHLTPSGEEGHKYTAEEVYKMLESPPSQKKKEESGGGSGKKSQGKNSGSSKQDNQGNSSKQDNQGNSSKQDRQGNASKQDRQGNASKQDNQGNASKQKNQGGASAGKSRQGEGSGGSWDDHTLWGSKMEDDVPLTDLWRARVADAAEAIAIRDAVNGRGTLPLCAKRILEEMKKPKTDWRTVLNEFVEEEIVDYSFSPPDRRFDESPFFLPDFCEKDEKVKNILFMIDTSGSMSDGEITEAYSEIKGAIDQFGGRLSGWLGFFDAVVVPPEPFAGEDEFSVIRPKGGGGTSFDVVFSYVEKEMADEEPVSIVILTDGYAPFPKESAARGIPVLWMINNDKVTPPWGKIARLL